MLKRFLHSPRMRLDISGMRDSVFWHALLRPEHFGEGVELI
jgi:hypothetical protein